MSKARSTEVVIVGGGPAGASCARELRKAGVECLVLDRERFPRLKLCAGWITPEVVADLEMDPAEYPHSFLTFAVTRAHIFGLNLPLRAPQHSIRRIEFDDWLLRRSGAEVIQHEVRQIERVAGGYHIDDVVRAKYVVGAGGTRCPVYRHLFRDANPRARELQAAVLEHEFPYKWRDGDCHLWFFERGLPGYAWYVPKQNGHLNVGIGGMAYRLKRSDGTIKQHWPNFLARLRRQELIDGATIEPGGYSYYLRAGVDIARLDDAFVVGDAAGLATRDMCEGIGPAVRSGILAARAISTGAEYSLESVPRYSLQNGVARRLLEYAYLRNAA